MSRHVELDLNAQIYESGGFIFGKWKDCRIILYSDSRLDWFFDQTKLAGTLYLKDLRNFISFDGVSASAPQSKPFVPKLIKANLLFSVANDKSAKYYHWFLFESRREYHKFCDTVCLQIEKTRATKNSSSSPNFVILFVEKTRATKKSSSSRSPSVDSSKRKPRTNSSALPNRLRFLRGINGSQEGSVESRGSRETTPTTARKFIGGRIYGSQTPNPIRRILEKQQNTSSVDAMLDKL
uniref:PH domain-containing protein n=1 Tax=Panagrolaimus sp. PS1159 TaxID=55785 RepID=A0AC35FKM4_9BILA